MNPFEYADSFTQAAPAAAPRTSLVAGIDQAFAAIDQEKEESRQQEQTNAELADVMQSHLRRQADSGNIRRLSDAEWAETETELRNNYPGLGDLSQFRQQIDSARRFGALTSAMRRIASSMTDKEGKPVTDPWQAHRIGTYLVAPYNRPEMETEELSLRVQQHLPGVGLGTNIGLAQRRERAARRLEEGTATTQDMNELALATIEQINSRDQSFGERTAGILAMMPAHAIEFLMSGGTAAAIRNRAAAVGTRIIGQQAAQRVAQTIAANAALRVGSRVASTVASHAAVPSMSTFGQSYLAERAVPTSRGTSDAPALDFDWEGQTGIPAAVGRSAVRAAVESGAEALGGALAPEGLAPFTRWIATTRPGIVANRLTPQIVKDLYGQFLTTRVGDNLRRMGVSGPLLESLEERAGEVANWALLGDDAGLLGDAVAGRWQEVATQLGSEAVAFGAFGGGMAVANRITNPPTVIERAAEQARSSLRRQGFPPNVVDQRMAEAEREVITGEAREDILARIDPQSPTAGYQRALANSPLVQTAQEIAQGRETIRRDVSESLTPQQPGAMRTHEQEMADWQDFEQGFERTFQNAPGTQQGQQAAPQPPQAPTTAPEQAQANAAPSAQQPSAQAAPAAVKRARGRAKITPTQAPQPAPQAAPAPSAQPAPSVESRTTVDPAARNVIEEVLRSGKTIKGKVAIDVGTRLGITPQEATTMIDSLVQAGELTVERQRGSDYLRRAPAQSASQVPIEAESRATVPDHVISPEAAFAPSQAPLPAQPGTQQTAQAAANAPSDTEMISAISRMFPQVAYNFRRLRGKMQGLINKFSGLVTLSGRYNSAPAFLHEVAHWISKSRNIIPAKYMEQQKKIPIDVLGGLIELDYDPHRGNLAQSVDEGFAEAIRMRAMNQLPANASPNVQAAIAWAESQLNAEELQKLDRIRGMFEAQASLDPEQRAAQRIASPGQTVQERLEALAHDGPGVWMATNRKFNDRFIDLLNFEKAAIRTGRYKPGPGMLSSDIMMANRHAADANAELMMRRGPYALVRRNGQVDQVHKGEGVEEMTSDLLPEDLNPMAQGRPSRAGLFTVARHIINEVDVQLPRRRNLNPDQHLPDPVPPHVLQEMRDAMAEMQKDAAFVARATKFAQRFTANWNATREVQVLSELLDEENFNRMVAAHPTYAALYRVKPDGSATGAGTQGVLPGLMTQMRTESGYDIMDPLEAYLMRLRFLARVMTEHQTRLSVREAAQAPDMGGFINKAPAETKVSKLGAQQIEQVLTSAQISPAVIDDIKEAMGEQIYSYFTPAMPSADGRLLYGVYVPVQEKDKATGKTVTRIKPEFWEFHQSQKELHALLTGKHDQEFREAMEAWGFLGKVIHKTAGAQKFGGVTVSHTFQAANIPRDALFTFWRNSGVPLTIGNAAALAANYPRVFRYYLNLLAKRPTNDPLFDLFRYGGGELQRAIGFDAPGIQRRVREVTGNTTMFGRAVDVVRNKGQLFLKLLGAGESAPRVLAAQRYLEKHGITMEELKRRTEQDPNSAPIPWNLLTGALRAGQEALINYQRTGTTTRYWNHFIPFLGAYQAAMSQTVRGWATSKGRRMAAARMVATLMAIHLLHWLLFKDEDWYAEQRGKQNRSWIVKIPGAEQFIALPQPLEAEAFIGNTFRDLLNLWDGNNPQFESSAWDFAHRTLPSNWMPPPAPTALQIAMNRQFDYQRPIVPERLEDIPEVEKWTRYRLPYAADQLTGGIASSRWGRMPFATGEERGSIQDFYQEMTALDGLRQLAREDGTAFPQRERLLSLERFSSLLSPTWAQARMLQGAERQAMQEFQQAVAQIALGRTPRYNPFLNQGAAPESVRPALRQFIERVQSHARSRVSPGPDFEQRRQSVTAAQETLRLIRR